MILVFVWLAAIAAAVYLYLKEVYSRFSNYGVKHKKPTPFLGDMGDFLRRKKHIVELWNDPYFGYPTERFVGRYEFTKPILVMRDMDLLKKIAVKDYEYFLDHALSVNQDIDPLFGRILFALQGQEWKDMRSTLSPAFTSSKIRNMVPFIVEVGDQMVAFLKRQLKESGMNYIDVEVKDISTRYANDVIASCAFGLRVDSYSNPDNTFYKYAHLSINFTFKQILKFFGYRTFPSLMKHLRIKLFTEEIKNFYMNLVTDAMNDRETNNIQRPDMIHLLMEAKKGQLTHKETADKDADAGFATVEESDVGKKSINRVWTDIDLAAQVVLFLRAGFETVSTAMTFTLYELALQPEIQEQLAQEIKDHYRKTGGKLDYNNIHSMVYLDMVISEILRLWPPVIAIDRICIKDYNLGKPNKEATKDYIIKAGEVIAIPLNAIHRDPRNFPNPDKFDPERFSEENKRNIHSYDYMPFGLGPRNCIASRFALIELKVMLYQIILNMEVSACEKTPIPAQLQPGGFSMRLKGGLYLRMRTRN